MLQVSPTSRLSEATGGRFAYADNLKVVLVAGVIVAHVTMAWTGVGEWVFEEPPVREPLLSILTLATVIAALFGLPLFFLIAGAFTPPSLARKGVGRFLRDRLIRLGIPMVFFVLVLSPVIEYVDPENVGWDRGFAAFAVHIWWPPAPGPTWFLGVLLVFSAGYAMMRAIAPRRVTAPAPLRLVPLLAAAMVMAMVSYGIRFVVPLGTEHWRLALGQAPAWVLGFTLGVVGGERGWFGVIDPATARRLRHVAWGALAASVAFFGGAAVAGSDLAVFAGGGTWQSLLTAVLEGVLVVAASLWLIDVFRRRLDHQGRLAREMSRAAFAAFVLHQVVLVGLVLASRQVPWPPEVEYLLVATVGVAASFGLGALAVRLPGVSRVV